MNFAACSLSELYQIIQMTINAGWISVYVDPTGQIREYTVPFYGGGMLSLECERITNGNEYTIYLDDDVVAYAKIPATQKIHTPDEEAILFLFNLCSGRVIAQEINARLSSKNQKIYS